jgi:hypothetical protein
MSPRGTYRNALNDCGRAAEKTQIVTWPFSLVVLTTRPAATAPPSCTRLGNTVNCY